MLSRCEKNDDRKQEEASAASDSENRTRGTDMNKNLLFILQNNCSPCVFMFRVSTKLSLHFRQVPYCVFYRVLHSRNCTNCWNIRKAHVSECFLQRNNRPSPKSRTRNFLSFLEEFHEQRIDDNDDDSVFTRTKTRVAGAEIRILLDTEKNLTKKIL